MTARPANPHTIAARTGVDTDTAHGAVMPPLYLSSNYSFAGFDQKRKYDYSRSGNPTRDVLAETLTELEGGAGLFGIGAEVSELGVRRASRERSQFDSSADEGAGQLQLAGNQHTGLFALVGIHLVAGIGTHGIGFIEKGDGPARVRLAHQLHGDGTTADIGKFGGAIDHLGLAILLHVQGEKLHQ